MRFFCLPLRRSMGPVDADPGDGQRTGRSLAAVEICTHAVGNVGCGHVRLSYGSGSHVCAGVLPSCLIFPCPAVLGSRLHVRCPISEAAIHIVAYLNSMVGMDQWGGLLQRSEM